jgi:hypothetical protein
VQGPARTWVESQQCGRCCGSPVCRLASRGASRGTRPRRREACRGSPAGPGRAHYHVGTSVGAFRGRGSTMGEQGDGADAPCAVLLPWERGGRRGRNRGREAATARGGRQRWEAAVVGEKNLTLTCSDTM